MLTEKKKKKNIKHSVKICDDVVESLFDNFYEDEVSKGEKIDQEKLWVGWENPFLPDGNLSKEADRMLEIWRKSGIWICDQQSCTHSQVEVYNTVKVQSSESENGPKTPKVPTLTDVKQGQKCCHIL